MKAKKKPIDTMKPGRPRRRRAPRLTVLKVRAAGAQAGVKVGSVAELVDKAEERSEGDLMMSVWSRRTRQRGA
jgi:electron transfer flavoprotein beta subunit